MKKIPVECYSRIVGYFQPIRQWNPGKREEFSQRKEFTLDKIKKELGIATEAHSPG